MSFYTSRALARSLGAFSAFGGGGRTIFGPFTFTESWSSDDFESADQFTKWVKPYLSEVSRTGLTFTPLSASTVTKASLAWNQWQAASDQGSGSADAYMASITAQMKDLIARADALSLTTKGWPFAASRTEGVEVSRYDIFNQIGKLVKQVASSAGQATTALNNAVAAGNVAEPVVGGPTASHQAATGVQGGITSPASGGSRSPVPSGSDNTLLYVGLGVGALVLVGGSLLLFRKKSAVAGYRRRGRR